MPHCYVAGASLALVAAGQCSSAFPHTLPRLKRLLPRLELTPAHLPPASLPRLPSASLPRPPTRPLPQLFVMFIAQGALVRWRKRHKRRCGSGPALRMCRLSTLCSADAHRSIVEPAQFATSELALPELPPLQLRPGNASGPVAHPTHHLRAARCAAIFSSFSRHLWRPNQGAAQPLHDACRHNPRALLLPAS